MATKKQKREAALAKREAFDREMRELGLKAQRADQEKREREHLQVWEKRHEKHYKFDDQCPHCEAIKKGLRTKSATAAINKMPRPTQRKSPAPKLTGDVRDPFKVVENEDLAHEMDTYPEDGASLEMECI